MKKHMQSLFIIILGNILLAAGVSLFLLPCGFVSGGATGMGIIAGHFFGIPISLAVLTFNALFFLMGLVFLGKRFAITTLMSTFLYPFCLEIFQRIADPAAFTEDTLLAALYAGLLCGAGLGLVFKEGASTGGTDIPVMILHRKKGLSLEAGLYLTDGLVILGQAVFARPSQILYGLLIMILTSFVIGRIELMGNSQFQLLIISPFFNQIREELLHSLDTGATLFDIENGLKATPSQAVLTVIPRRKLNEITTLIQKIDPAAFITIHEIKEVKGRGFSLAREYVKEERKSS